MTNYPYGRRGELKCYNSKKTTLSELTNSGGLLDNEIHISGDIVYLYEAPIEQDPGRGHYSKWRRVEDNTFEQVEAMSGDDGMIYEKFTEAI